MNKSKKVILSLSLGLGIILGSIQTSIAAPSCHVARHICQTYLGLTPGTTEFDTCVANIGGMWCIF